MSRVLLLRSRLRLSAAACTCAWLGREQKRQHCSGWTPWSAHVAETKPRAEAQKIGRYVLDRTLGSGAYGVVKLATDSDTGMRVALKLVPKKDEVCTSALEQEVQTLEAVCPHRYVVNMLDHFETPQHKALVMELMAGGEVFEHICDEGAYSEADAARIVREVALALQHLHSRGVCHRDLKPENLLLVSRDEHADVKLCDFGLAAFVDKAQLHGKAGSLAYMAPEIHKGLKYSASVDMWSLGVLAYILLAGYHPFDESGTGDDRLTATNIMAAEYNFDDPCWSHVSADAKQVIKRLLTLKPDERPTPEELLTMPWVSGEAASSHPLPGAHESLRSFNETRKKWRTAVRAASFVRHTPQTFGALRTRTGGQAVEDLPPEVVSELKGAFDAFDRDHSGTIDSIELSRMFHRLGVPSAQAQQVLQAVDTDGNGCISFSEFCSAVGHLASPTDSALRTVFELFDVDGNGTIDRGELRAMILKLGMIDEKSAESSAKVEATVDSMFKEADTDGDGRISFEEFRSVLESTSRGDSSK